MRFHENEEAVSPVIGVILMVAITVILAAVIAVFVFGMTDDVQTNHNVAITSKLVNDSAVMLTFQGGPDAGIVNYLNVTTFDSTGAFDDSASYTLSNGGTWTAGVYKWDAPTVGESLTIGGLPDSGRVMVTAFFTDGNNQQIINKQF